MCILNDSLDEVSFLNQRSLVDPTIKSNFLILEEAFGLVGVQVCHICSVTDAWRNVDIEESAALLGTLSKCEVVSFAEVELAGKHDNRRKLLQEFIWHSSGEELIVILLVLGLIVSGEELENGCESDASKLPGR